jgi:hypothetical protein
MYRRLLPADLWELLPKLQTWANWKAWKKFAEIVFGPTWVTLEVAFYEGNDGYYDGTCDYAKAWDTDGNELQSILGYDYHNLTAFLDNPNGEPLVILNVNDVVELPALYMEE